jgi:hypothetical protein
VLLDAIYACEIYNLCYVCDTLCFVGNGTFVIHIMCVMNTSKKELKNKKQSISSGFFYPKSGGRFTVFSTIISVISTGLLVGSDFRPFQF